MTISDQEWNIALIVDGASPTEVKKKLDAITNKVETMFTKYTKQISSMDAKSIADMLREIEKVTIESGDIFTYCGLHYSANSTLPESEQLSNWSRNAGSKMQALLTVLEIEIGKVLLQKPEILTSPELKDYTHYLEGLMKKAPFRLSDVEEKLIAKKDVNGTMTLSQLQSSWVSQKCFEIEINGEKKTVSLPTLSSLRMDPDSSIREMASRTLYKSYADDKLLHGFALRAICADHVDMSHQRGLPSTMEWSLLGQDIDQSTADALLGAIENSADPFQDFLKLKAKVMGKDRLLGYDVIAPWVTEPVLSFDWKRGRDIVIDSVQTFDSEMGAVVKGVFDEHRIDSASRVGKENTAFCAGWRSAKKSFVMMTYDNTMNDLYTLAHEVGHASQGHLTYQAQIPTNYGASMCMAETGSIFGELLLTDKLLSQAKTDEERFEILSHVLNGFFYTTYYVATRAFFEQDLYAAIEDDKVISADLACDMWNTSKSRIFGNAVDWTEYMEYEWARIPHFFFTGRRFYNYPYSFAQMLVFAVYEEFLKGESDFNPRFKKLLSSGRSKSPKEQIAEFGYDLTDPGFWELGPKQADRLLSELKKLI